MSGKLGLKDFLKKQKKELDKFKKRPTIGSKLDAKARKISKKVKKTFKKPRKRARQISRNIDSLF